MVKIETETQTIELSDGVIKRLLSLLPTLIYIDRGDVTIYNKKKEEKEEGKNEST